MKLIFDHSQSIFHKGIPLVYKIKITNFTSNSNIEKPIGFEWYNYGNYEDFYFDNIFWGRVLFIEDQVIYTIMNKTNDKKSYGTLSYYYLLEKFRFLGLSYFLKIK